MHCCRTAGEVHCAAGRARAPARRGPQRLRRRWCSPAARSAPHRRPRETSGQRWQSPLHNATIILTCAPPTAVSRGGTHGQWQGGISGTCLAVTRGRRARTASATVDHQLFGIHRVPPPPAEVGGQRFPQRGVPEHGAGEHSHSLTSCICSRRGRSTAVGTARSS